MAWALSAIRDKILDTSYLQSDQVYIESNYIYGFDRQKTFRAGYMTGNRQSNRGHRRYDGKNIGYRSSLLAKGKWNRFYRVVSLWQGGQAFKSTHFL